MERFVQVFGGITGNGPLNSQELQKPIPSSYPYSMFNPQQVPNTFCFGLASTEQVNPPVPLFNASKDENSNLGNSQRSNTGNQMAEGGTEKKQPVYQRLRWTDEMVKVLITAVSYIEEDSLPDSLKNETGKLLAPIKGKWRAISKAMIEKGYFVSPQQCEDKFNDLNKRYKRLNEILGKGTSCDIVKNPSLLDFLSISEEAKDEVMKLLGCKQLFYREMCSFHNKNRKYLPRDEGLKKTVQSALKGKVKYVSQNLGVPAKIRKQGEGSGVSGRFTVTNAVGELTNLPLEAVEGIRDLDQWMKSRSVNMEEKALMIKNQMLELQKSRIEWMKLCEKEDTELNKMRLENELMKLENERLAYELECRKKGYVCNS